jgi:dipeptidyl aminopeptidase/acylaminoacyl peptidase
MRRSKTRLSLAVVLAAVLAAAAGQTQAPKPEAKPAPPAPRPIGLPDILAWKSVSGFVVSPDGRWAGFRVAPVEGDGEVIFRETRGTKTYKFPAGEGRSGQVALSEDGTFGVFLVFPEAKEAKKLRKERKRLYNKAAVVNLATGEKAEYEKIRAFAFSGENPGWVALHKAAPEGQEREREKWSGSDLILRELATGRETMLGNVSEFAFDKKGRWLAMAVDAYGMAGNGVAVRDMASGVVSPLDNDKAVYRSLRWTEKGEALACIKGKEDKAYEDKLHALLGFTGFAGAGGAKGASPGIQKTVYDPKEDKVFPQGMTISPNRPPQWTEGLDALLFGVHEPKKKADGTPASPAAPSTEAPAAPGGEADEDMPDLVLWHHLDKRLQSQQQVEANRDQNFSYLAEYRPAEKAFIRLADDGLRQVAAGPKGLFAVGQDVREYELEGNLDGRRYQDVYVIDLKTGARTLALKKARWTYDVSTDGTRLLYYDDGAFFALELATGKTTNLTRNTPANFINEDDDHNVKNPPDFPVGWSTDGKTVYLSDGWDIWGVPVHGGPGVNITGNGRRDRVRYRSLVSLDPEAKGIDLAKPHLVSMSGEWTKKTGWGRVEQAKPGVTVLLWDEAGFGFPLKPRKAEMFFYTRDTSRDFPDWYVADGAFKNAARLTEANPQQKDFFWSSGSMLLDYEMDPRSGKEAKLQAALFLPSNYEKGKKYPTVVYYYEKMSQQLNRYASPSANGFNKSVYTSNGYAVLMPDITYKVNDPGMSAVWCVLPALEAAVATGVVDRARVGLHGHSWGGYQTAFLVTQADFAAAVAGAPLTNMISMYSSIYFNTGGGNMAIFESSQGRFLGGYWDNLEAYQRNSPVYYAARVQTPLIILHNDKDGAVDWNQGIEYYNTLRRLKKPVIMLQYVGENHGLAKAANQKDYTVRMREWFDHWLKGQPAPAWMVEGIPHLKMKDHLKERMKAWKPEEKKEPDRKEPDKKDR